MRKVMVVAVLGVTACGNKSSAPAAGSASSAASASGSGSAKASGSATGSGSAKASGTAAASGSATAKIASKKPAKGTPPSVSKDQLAAYRKHLSAGRKLGADKRWGEAVTEFEAALTAVPKDARALAELGLAAYAAGDYPKARKADNDAVRVAAEPKVRAASYYNLGLVDEAEKDLPAAANAYMTSLALRPGNATVEKALARLGKTPPAPGEVVDHANCQPGTVDALCTCLLADASPPTDPDTEKASCAPAEVTKSADDAYAALTVAPPAGFQVLEVDDHEDMSILFYLASGTGANTQVIAALGTAYNPGMMGISETMGVDKLELRTFGTHQVLWVETHHEHYDSDAGISEAESETTRDVVLCPIVAGKPTTCVLDVQLEDTYDRDVVGDDNDDPDIHHTPGLPFHDERQLSVDVSADGVATVKLVKGTPPDDKSLLGPHKLF